MTTELHSTGSGLTDPGVRSSPLVRGVNFSHGRPGAGAVTAAGYGFACRYLWHDGTDRTALTRAEVEDYLRHGVGVRSHWEWQADRTLRGFDVWGADARSADAAHRAAADPRVGRFISRWIST